LGAIKPKGLNRIVNIGYKKSFNSNGYTCIKNKRFEIPCIFYMV
jgi:hypothetical protein